MKKVFNACQKMGIETTVRWYNDETADFDEIEPEEFLR